MKKNHINTSKRKVGDVLEDQNILTHGLIVIITSFALCLNPAVTEGGGVCKTKCQLAKQDNFSRRWEKTSTVLADMFGTTNLLIADSNKLSCLDAFEKFVSREAAKNNRTLIEKTVDINDLPSLPKPLILLNIDKTDFTVLLGIFEFEQYKVYQVLYNEDSPKLIKAQKLLTEWAGEVWYTENTNQKKVVQKSDSLELQVSQSIYNFGLVKPSKQHGAIQIKNTGKNPIKIKRAKSSCSCTVTKPDTDIILQPSQETEIDLAVSVRDGQRGFRHSIIFPIEDLNNKEKHFFKIDVMGNCDIEETVDGMVNSSDALLKIAPRKLLFTNVKLGGVYKQELLLTAKPEFKLDSIHLKSSTPMLALSALEKIPYQEMNKHLIEISLDGRQMEKGKKYDERIYLDTDNDQYKHIEIPVHIETEPVIKVYPSKIIWGVANMNEKLSRTIYFTSPYGDDLKIAKCVVPNNTKTEIKELGKDINLTVTSQFSKPGEHQEELKFFFSSPEGLEISIPMLVNVRRANVPD